MSLIKIIAGTMSGYVPLGVAFSGIRQSVWELHKAEVKESVESIQKGKFYEDAWAGVRGLLLGSLIELLTSTIPLYLFLSPPENFDDLSSLTKIGLGSCLFLRGIVTYRLNEKRKLDEIQIERYKVQLNRELAGYGIFSEVNEKTRELQFSS